MDGLYGAFMVQYSSWRLPVAQYDEEIDSFSAPEATALWRYANVFYFLSPPAQSRRHKILKKSNMTTARCLFYGEVLW